MPSHNADNTPGIKAGRHKQCCGWKLRQDCDGDVNRGPAGRHGDQTGHGEDQEDQPSGSGLEANCPPQRLTGKAENNQ